MRRSLMVATLWLLAFVTCGWIVARAHYSTDLSAFLPSAPDVRQRLLVKLLRDGPTSQMVLISIERSDLATRARLSHELAMMLRTHQEFTSIANGEQEGFERDGAMLFRNRYLISQAITPERFTVSGLTQAMQAAVAQQGGSLGLLGADLLAHDPTGETQQILDQLDISNHPRSVAGVWVSQDGVRAILMARTAASGADTDGQIQAIAIIRDAFSQLNSRLPATTSATMNLSGPGVFAAEARRTIQHEVGRLSALSTLLIGSLLLLVYRSVTVLMLGFLPVIFGALAGLTAVALTFNVVYGITLGFGITLIGEAVDYSVYLFIQAERKDTGTEARLGSRWTTSLWPVIRLGMLTSVCGFASLLPSAFPSLAQLGLYTIAGLIAAALVTRYMLPSLLHRAPYIQTLELPTRVLIQVIAFLRRIRLVLWPLALLALVALFFNRGQLWNRELSALSPVSLADQRRDATLRADLGAADVSELVTVSGSDSDRVLRAAEQVTAKLDVLVSSHDIAGYDSPSRYLPSQAAQQARRDSLPDESTLRVRAAAAADAAGLQATQLEPFIADVAAARQGPLLSRRDLNGTTLATGMDSLLVRLGPSWTALLPLRSVNQGERDPSVNTVRLNDALATLSVPGVEITALNLKSESDALYGDYLRSAIRLCSAGLVAIALLLWIALRSFSRAALVLLPLALAALAVAAGFALSHNPMNILHLIGLLLIFAVGSNYALFFDRAATQTDQVRANRTLSSLLLANLTTTIAFGVLATSSVPVLSALGSTVAPGAFLALLFSAVLARTHAGMPPVDADAV
jgi:predicted exporter